MSSLAKGGILVLACHDHGDGALGKLPTPAKLLKLQMSMMSSKLMKNSTPLFVVLYADNVCFRIYYIIIQKLVYILIILKNASRHFKCWGNTR